MMLNRQYNVLKLGSWVCTVLKSPQISQEKIVYNYSQIQEVLELIKRPLNKFLQNSLISPSVFHNLYVAKQSSPKHKFGYSCSFSQPSFKQLLAMTSSCICKFHLDLCHTWTFWGFKQHLKSVSLKCLSKEETLKSKTDGLSEKKKSLSSPDIGMGFSLNAVIVRYLHFSLA